MTQTLISILRTASKRIVTTARNTNACPEIGNIDQSARKRAAKVRSTYPNQSRTSAGTQYYAQNQSDQPPAQTPQRHQSP